MRKVICLAAILCGSSVFAQTEKGSWYLGGNLGISTHSEKQGSGTDKTTSWSFSPEVGVFVANNIQVGLGIISNGSIINYSNGSRYNDLMLGGLVYGRYFFGELSFKPFVGVNFGYSAGQSKITQSPSGSTTKSNVGIINANINAGFAYYVTPRMGIFGSVGVLGFSSSTSRISGFSDETTTDFGFNVNTLGNRFTLGIYYTFKQGVRP